MSNQETRKKEIKEKIDRLLKVIEEKKKIRDQGIDSMEKLNGKTEKVLDEIENLLKEVKELNEELKKI